VSWSDPNVRTVTAVSIDEQDQVSDSQTGISPDGSGPGSAVPGGDENSNEHELEEAFDRLVIEGNNRLNRSFAALSATGFLGGIDVGVGVLAYLVVRTETGNALLGSLAFTLGFVGLLMARSELFTENFLVPVTAVAARRGSVGQLLRLWAVSLPLNLAGGFVMAGMIVVALPEVRPTAIEVGTHHAHLGVSWQSFFLAVLAGAVITLMSRMQQSTDSIGVKIVPAVLMSFVLVGAGLFHSVLDSILMFAGLLSGGAPYGWFDWLGALVWAVFGNILGGLVFVTGIRLVRVSHRVIAAQQER